MTTVYRAGIALADSAMAIPGVGIGVTDIVKDAGTLLTNAERVEKALAGLSAPQAELNKALAARDAHLPDWQRSLRRLRLILAAAWIDEPETHAAVFAPREAIMRPVKQRKSTKRANAPAATPKNTATPA